MEHGYLFVEDLAGVTSEMIAEYLACIRVEVSATTYNNRVCVLREIFHTLAAKAGLEEDPWQGVRLRPDDSHSRRELTMGELRRLLEAAKKMDQEVVVDSCSCRKELASCAAGAIGSGLEAAATVGVGSGLEAAATVGGRQNKEGGSVDRCSTSTFNLNLLSGPVLPTISAMYEKGGWRVAHGLKKIFAAANITTSVKLEGRRVRAPEATFHSLRHTFVSFAANAGVPLHIVQSIVGHESTAMTRHYYHENIAALQSAVAAIPTL